MSALWLGPSDEPPPDVQELIDALHTPWAPWITRLRRLGRAERRRPAEVTRLPVLETAAEEAA